MQAALVEHYVNEYLDNWLTSMARKFPLSPLSAVIQNHLYLSDDGTEVNRLRLVAHELYSVIKRFEEIPDELAYEPTEPGVDPATG